MALHDLPIFQVLLLYAPSILQALWVFIHESAHKEVAAWGIEWIKLEMVTNFTKNRKIRKKKYETELIWGKLLPRSKFYGWSRTFG